MGGRTFLFDMDGMLMDVLLRIDGILEKSSLLYADLEYLFILHPFLKQLTENDHIMSASFRTDLYIDLAGTMQYINENNPGVSLTDVLEKIAQVSKAKLDKFLYGDFGIGNNIDDNEERYEFGPQQPDGTAWKEITDFYERHRNLSDPSWANQATATPQRRMFPDYYKIIKIFALLHRVAEKHNVSPENPYEVVFNDDLAFILNTILDFYSKEKHSDWLPAGLTLRVNQYAPGLTADDYPHDTIMPTELGVIHGTGPRQPHFALVARELSMNFLTYVEGYPQLDQYKFVKEKANLLHLGIHGHKKPINQPAPNVNNVITTPLENGSKKMIINAAWIGSQHSTKSDGSKDQNDGSIKIRISSMCFSTQNTDPTRKNESDTIVSTDKCSAQTPPRKILKLSF